MMIIVINHFVIIGNFRNHFDKALMKIFQFHRVLFWIDLFPERRVLAVLIKKKVEIYCINMKYYLFFDVKFII